MAITFTSGRNTVEGGDSDRRGVFADTFYHIRVVQHHLVVRRKMELAHLAFTHELAKLGVLGSVVIALWQTARADLALCQFALYAELAPVRDVTLGRTDAEICVTWLTVRVWSGLVLWTMIAKGLNFRLRIEGGVGYTNGERRWIEFFVKPLARGT